VDELPRWQPGTAMVLSTAGAHPHAIAVSTAVRAGPRRILLALALGRGSLARVRSDPRCALTILAAGDVACTVHARAEVVADPIAELPQVAAIALEVLDIQDHRRAEFVIEAAPAWRWVDDDARERDAAVRHALEELARR
jgi:hypothetical protein